MRTEVIIMALLTWIGAADDDLEYKAYPLPAIQYVSADELARMTRPGVDPKDVEIWGTYDEVENVVYLRKTVDLKTNEGKAVLAHELVHYLQWKQGKWGRVRCLAQLEPQAYEIENAYRKEHGLDKWASVLTILVRSLCSGKGGPP